MMSDAFTPEQIAEMTAEINAQLQTLATKSALTIQRGDAPGKAALEDQRRAIESMTRQDATTFLARFRATARKDMCEKDGVLHQQWVKYRDIASKDLLKFIGGLLLGMGLSGTALQIVAVAIAVYILHLGLSAFCAGEHA